MSQLISQHSPTIISQLISQHSAVINQLKGQHSPTVIAHSVKQQSLSLPLPLSVSYPIHHSTASNIYQSINKSFRNIHQLISVVRSTSCPIIKPASTNCYQTIGIQDDFIYHPRSYTWQMVKYHDFFLKTEFQISQSIPTIHQLSSVNQPAMCQSRVNQSSSQSVDQSTVPVMTLRSLPLETKAFPVSPVPDAAHNASII